jgi:hypothetical protein
MFFKILRNIPKDRGQMTRLRLRASPRQAEDRCPSKGRMTNDCPINYLIKELKKDYYKYLNNYIFFRAWEVKGDD